MFSQVNLFTISAICVAASTSIMAVFMFLTSHGNRANIMWGWFCLSAAIWGFGGIFFSTTSSPEVAMFWWSVGYIGATIVPVQFAFFVFDYLELEKKILRRVLYVTTAFFLGLDLIFPELYIGNMKFLFGEFYYLDWTKYKSPFYVIWYVSYFWVILLYAFALLIKHFLHAKGLKRNQMKYLILGSAVGWIGGHGDFFPAFGVEVYPYSNFVVAIYPLVIGYAIIRYRLMGFDIIVKKGLIYSVLITSITSLYLISIRASEQFFQHFFGYQTMAGSISITLVIAVLFNPLKNRIQDFVDRIVFRGTTAEMAKQNELLKLQVEQADRYKTMADLTSGIIKEIGKPLQILQKSDEELEQKQDDPAFLHQYAAREKQEIEKVNTLLEHLMNYSNPIALSTQKTSIHRLISETLGMLKGELTDKKIKLAQEFKVGEDIKLSLDPSQMRQALSNIIINAIEAMPEGGKLYIGTEGGEGCVRVIIKDTGDGIRAEDVARLYDPFFSRKDGHVGLGLSVARGIVENHQGKIRVRSEVGFGTEFSIELPL